MFMSNPSDGILLNIGTYRRVANYILIKAFMNLSTAFHIEDVL